MLDDSSIGRWPLLAGSIKLQSAKLADAQVPSLRALTLKKKAKRMRDAIRPLGGH